MEYGVHVEPLEIPGFPHFLFPDYFYDEFWTFPIMSSSRGP